MRGGREGEGNYMKGEGERGGRELMEQCIEGRS